MRKVDLTIEICGSAAGDGTLAAGEILTRALSDMGYYVLSFDEYPAEIRGFGKCVAHLRVSDWPIYSVGRGVDILVSLNDPYSIQQLPTLKPNGAVIFDSWPMQELGEKDCVAGHLSPGMFLYGTPMNELSQRSTQSSKSRNLVALGVVAALFDIDVESFVLGLKQKFKKKPKVAAEVESAFLAGVDYAHEKLIKLDKLTLKLERPLDKREYVLMNGNEAAAQGAIDAKCRFYAGYPITPATKIMEILSERLPAEGGSVVQTEDEIAAIGMVTGAAAVGIRAMTATSGPGICLMSEFIGYNVMAENPVVIVDSQRAGPATGLPTKTEQSDLMLAIHSGNGDAPRIVVAPTNVEECHYWIAEAFYLAEKYQLPVIVLLDLFLSTCKVNATLKKIDPAKLSANKNPTADDLKNYKRYKLTDDGVSPRAIPGLPGGECVNSGLEQTEDGTPSYDATVHTNMSDKRWRKIKSALANDVPKPERYGKSGQVDVGVLAWGSTTGAAVEAVERANDKGLSVAGLKQVVVNPIHAAEVKAFCRDCKTILVPELNSSGQFADLLGKYCGGEIVSMTLSSGKPITWVDVLGGIERAVAR